MATDLAQVCPDLQNHASELAFLKETRALFLAHPSSGWSHVFGIEGPFCRLSVVAIVAAVECVLRHSQHAHPGLAEYFDRRSENGRKAEVVHRWLESKGLQVPYGLTEDFIALKYLRNRLVHPEKRL